MDKYSDLSLEFLEFIANGLMENLANAISSMDGSKWESGYFKSDKEKLFLDIGQHFKRLTNEDIGFNCTGSQCFLIFGDRKIVVNTPYWLKLHYKKLWGELLY